jgi:hypothetical protein
MLVDRVRFCLIGYSDEARVLQPLVDLSSVSFLPGLHASGGISYAPPLKRSSATVPLGLVPGFTSLPADDI